jgi:glycine cleavage system protein P-like pyridoxal-binding family
MNFSGHFIKEIADGIEPTDAISKQQLDAVIANLNTIRDNLDKLFQYFFTQDSSFSLPVGGGNGRSE